MPPTYFSFSHQNNATSAYLFDLMKGSFNDVIYRKPFTVQTRPNAGLPSFVTVLMLYVSFFKCRKFPYALAPEMKFLTGGQSQLLSN